MSTATEVLTFWFETLVPELWFAKDPELDQMICDRFAEVHAQAAAGECFTWRETAEGRLAEIIVLDQFSRNIYRDQAQAFAQDAQALCLAQEAIAVRADRRFTPAQRSFLYMPFMHSESLKIHDVAVKLFDQPGMEHNLAFEQKHRALIIQFGRYPHRNALLGRTSTDEEHEYLSQPGAGF